VLSKQNLFLCAKAVLDRVVARRADSDVQARARIEEGAECQALRKEILKGRAGGAGGVNLAKVTPQDYLVMTFGSLWNKPSALRARTAHRHFRTHRPPA
jgi:hypothetical protein